MGANSTCTKRLQKELRELTKNPLPMLRALPSPSNLLEWHYVLEGAPDSDYAGGWYHGKVIFPSQYPMKPPAIIMLTPSGRFDPGSKICLSLSDFHPETWNPLWGVGLILLGLQSFFYENTSTTGALHGVSSAEKRRLAAKSLTYNLRNPTFRKLFPELLELHDQLERKKTEEVEPTPPQTEGLGRVEAGPGRGPLTGGFLQEVNGLEAPKHQLGWRTLVLGSVLALAAAATLGILMAIDS